ncbi:enoyl-CoA hydratase-related protein [Phenylobacterium sp.]|uniref:enoyl-CoA hydratase-related protein n=1 Tax=Phenylobacterium sp. TaxID=1871053 RepID=UPI00301DE854
MAEDSYSTITYELQERVAVVALNRPDRMNAFNGEMVTELKAAMARAVEDPKVRAIVLTGAGRAFCSGADMSSLAGGIPLSGDSEKIAALDAAFASDLGPDISKAVENAQRFGYLLRCKKPIIGAINGSAVGLGLVLALYCDVRFAAEEAFFMTAFGQRGLIAEHGMAWLMSRLIGPARTTDMLISSRRVPAAEAHAMGLVNFVSPKADLVAAAVSYAQAIATTMSPRAVAVMKAQVWHANFESFDSALITALDETRISVRHPDKDEGVASFVQKRPPNFADL